MANLICAPWTCSMLQGFIRVYNELDNLGGVDMHNWITKQSLGRHKPRAKASDYIKKLHREILDEKR